MNYLAPELKLPALLQPDRRALILKAEEAARPLEVMFPFEEKAEHHFAPGLYGRRLLMPAGSTVVGKIHKHAHLYAVSGHCKVYTEFSDFEVRGFELLTSQPMEKRVWHALEDTVIVTFHPTNETDLDKIEADVIAENYEVTE